MGKKIQTANGSAFKVGAISLAFLIIGYEAALFIHRASTEHVAAVRNKPDTVFVIDSSLAVALLRAEESRPSPETAGKITIRRESRHSAEVTVMRERSRKYESFRFNPNTASVDELQRLGFSLKQAQSIDNYRKKGGRFRRRSDFAKSFVVSDSIYSRLEQYIDIPLVDINTADSAAFDALPGIGGWFASRMVSYRKELGGYSCSEQLMEIYRFDEEKYSALADLIYCSAPRDSLDLWRLPADSLRRHPHIRNFQTARAIVLFRENTDPCKWSVQALVEEGILSPESGEKLSRCAIKKCTL